MNAKDNEAFWNALDPVPSDLQYDYKATEEWKVAGKYHVVFMGMLGFRILTVQNEKSAEGTLLWIQEHARKGGLVIPGYTRNASEYDFQVRTYQSLEELTAAIRSC